MQTDSPTTDRDRIYRRIQWRLVPFLMLCYLFASLDRTNIGYGKLQFMEQLGFTEAVYGLGAGLFYLGYLLFELPSNLVLQRIGIRLTFLRIMFAWGLCCALMALMRTELQFYGLRLLLGAAEAGFFPGVLYYLSRWAPDGRRARMTAMFMMSLAISGVVGGPISGQITSGMDGVGGLHGWQWLFIIEGLPASLLGIACWFYLPDSPDTARWLTDGEKALLRTDLAAARPAGGAHGSIAALLRRPQFWAMAAISFALTGGTGGLFLWLPTALRRAGIAEIGLIGLLAAVPFAIGAGVQQWVARRSDRQRERYWHAAWPAVAAGAGWFGLALAHQSVAGVMIAATVAAAGTLGAMGPFWALPPALLQGRNLAAAVALVTTAGGLGNFVGPIIVGAIATATGSLAWGYAYLGTVMLVAALALLATREGGDTAKRIVVSSPDR